jgi:hypothetical protein
LSFSASVAGDTVFAERIGTATEPFEPTVLGLLAPNAIRQMTTMAHKADRALAVARKTLAEFEVQRDSFSFGGLPNFFIKVQPSIHYRLWRSTAFITTYGVIRRLGDKSTKFLEPGALYTYLND